MKMHKNEKEWIIYGLILLALFIFVIIFYKYSPITNPVADVKSAHTEPPMKARCNIDECTFESSVDNSNSCLQVEVTNLGTGEKTISDKVCSGSLKAYEQSTKKLFFEINPILFVLMKNMV